MIRPPWALNVSFGPCAGRSGTDVPEAYRRNLRDLTSRIFTRVQRTFDIHFPTVFNFAWDSQ